MCLFVLASPEKLAIRALLSTFTIAVPSSSAQKRSPILAAAISTAVPIEATAAPSAARYRHAILQAEFVTAAVIRRNMPVILTGPPETVNTFDSTPLYKINDLR